MFALAMYKQPTGSNHSAPLRDQLIWVLFLSVLYLCISVAAWHRTLISDEIWYLLNAGRTLSEQLENLRVDLIHPPLMYLIERIWLDAFGRTDDAVKVLVVVINLGSIALFTAFAALVTRRWRLASFLLCTAYFQIGGVPNLARGYSLGLLLTIASMLSWERWRRTATVGWLALWTLMMILLVNTHYVGCLLLAPFVAINWIYGHRRWLFLGLASVAALSFVPWLVFVLPAYLSRGFTFRWIQPNPEAVLAKLPFHFWTYLPSGWNAFGQNVWPQSSRLRAALIVCAAVAHGSFLVSARRYLAKLWPPYSGQAADDPWFWSAILLGGFPIAALFTFSLTMYPVLDARFVSFALPAYWLLIALLVGVGGVSARLVMYAVLFPWLATSVAVPLVRNAGGSPLHRTLKTVAQQIQPTDLVLCERLAGPQVYWEWTRSLKRSEPILIVSRPWPEYASLLPLTTLETIKLERVNRVWLLSSLFNQAAADGIRAFLIDHDFRPQTVPSPALPFLAVFDRQTSVRLAPIP